MKPNEGDFDQRIKETVKDEFEKAPPSPLSRDETWAKIRGRLLEESDQKKRFRSHRYMKWIGIAAAVIIIAFGLLLFQSQNGSALGWVTRYILRSQGDVTQLQSAIGQSSGSASKSKPPIPDASEIQGHETMVTKKR